MRAEHELSLFLDRYFYDRLLQNHKITSYVRITDKKIQLQGIDVMVSTSRKTVNLDEKAQLYYINENLPTFAFEVNFIDRMGNLSPGWLFNDNLLTDYYVLVWPTATHNDLKTIQAEDFTCVECMLIKKNEIIDYLSELGYTSNFIEEIATGLRSQNKYGKHFFKNQNNFYLYFSQPNNYTEQPINIVIRKRLLKQLAFRIYVISKEKLIRIK